MKKITSIILLLLTFGLGYGQIKIAELTFESAGGYSTSITEFTDSAEDYFLRTDGSNTTSEVLSNIQGSFYFAANDIDGEGASLPVTLLLNNINISGYSGLEFRVYLAEDDDGANEDWDEPNYVHFNYDIDNTGSFNNLLWLENDGSTFNSAPFVDTDYDGDGDGTEITDTFVQFTQNIAGTGSLLDIQIIFNLDDGDEDIAIDNIEIWGTLNACGTAVTWNGTAWSNITGPDINTPAILNDDYNTLGSIGSFSACSLTLNDATLTIEDNTYVEVQNDITIDVDSAIDVQPEGSIVQNNDLSTITNNGTMTVDKLTAPMDAWYEYTYWSSPVSGETIEGAIDRSPANRRFIFNAQNYLDATAETNNDGSTDPGQDDIDDDYNDWQLVVGSSTMSAGVGYATTITSLAYSLAPGVSDKSFRFTFTGDFHNGVYKVPIYRNDSETNDNNWNLIGNPYPSAIDADLFLAANSNVSTTVNGTDYTGSGFTDGAIFLWSQDTDYSATANGGEALNFSNGDYAIINGIGETAGGDGLEPNRFIPSGQAFFVSMSNSASASLVSGDVYTTNVIFSNSMRVYGTNDNSQFFKTSSKTKKNNSSNKLKIDLTSDNGVFNQVLIGYVNGATGGFDGMYFDTAKISAGNNITAILYTVINGVDKKFAIQGKSPNNLNESETIALGFKNNIEVPTLFKLSLAQFKGDFITNNGVYLKDNLLNKVHNLSESDYTFTSEVGEFNDRFVIAFNNSVLSSEKALLDDGGLRVVDLGNDNVKFDVSNSLSINAIEIYDTLGRNLYTVSADSSSKIIKLSKLKSSIFIARVTLSNGAVITKKATKN